MILAKLTVTLIMEWSKSFRFYRVDWFVRAKAIWNKSDLEIPGQMEEFHFKQWLTNFMGLVYDPVEDLEGYKRWNYLDKSGRIFEWLRWLGRTLLVARASGLRTRERRQNIILKWELCVIFSQVLAHSGSTKSHPTFNFESLGRVINIAAAVAVLAPAVQTWNAPEWRWEGQLDSNSYTHRE